MSFLSEFEICVVYKEDGGIFPEKIHDCHILIFDIHLTVDRNNLYILLDTEEKQSFMKELEPLQDDMLLFWL